MLFNKDNVAHIIYLDRVVETAFYTCFSDMT